jgi:hypothetical protein
VRLAQILSFERQRRPATDLNRENGGQRVLRSFRFRLQPELDQAAFHRISVRDIRRQTGVFDFAAESASEIILALQDFCWGRD